MLTASKAIVYLTFNRRENGNHKSQIDFNPALKTMGLAAIWESLQILIKSSFAPIAPSSISSATALAPSALQGYIVEVSELLMNNW